MDPNDAARRLARAPGLARLSGADRSGLVARSRLRRLERGERLFEEGDEGRSTYLVLQGSLSIVRSAGGTTTTAVALRGPGEWVGELALLDGGARSASALADSACWVLEVPRDAFLDLLRRHPRLGVELAAAIGRRLRESDSALIDALQKRLEVLSTENRRLSRAVARRARAEDTVDASLFAGVSRTAERVRRAVAAAAKSELPVWIHGEAGTGRLALARAIHAGRDRPFVAVDCDLFTGRALEAELFGLAGRGLPGATSARRGAVEDADGGTLYLTGIDALPPWLQGLLVHFLREGEYRRVGEARPRSAALRIVAASAEDLTSRAREGRFRSDLLEAIDQIRIEVPPLRERRADVALVVEALLAELGGDAREPALRLSPEALAALARHDFPGNQRELRAILERLIAELGPGARVAPLDLARAIPGAPQPEPERYADAVRAFKVRLVTAALERTGGSRSEAARILELHPSNLTRLIRNLGIEGT